LRFASGVPAALAPRRVETGNFHRVCCTLPCNVSGRIWGRPGPIRWVFPEALLGTQVIRVFNVRLFVCHNTGVDDRPSRWISSRRSPARKNQARVLLPTAAHRDGVFSLLMGSGPFARIATVQPQEVQSADRPVRRENIQRRFFPFSVRRRHAWGTHTCPEASLVDRVPAQPPPGACAVIAMAGLRGQHPREQSEGWDCGFDH
jgi:hypothetical protein